MSKDNYGHKSGLIMFRLHYDNGVTRDIAAISAEEARVRGGEQEFRRNPKDNARIVKCKRLYLN